MSLYERVRAGDRLALARLLTQIEDEDPQGLDTLSALYRHTGHAHLVGVTGAPGTGKSTLVNQLAQHLRRTGSSVAIIAIDPSSPFSGGAILGDRIRMRDLAGDPGVFIRSMASRGALGGLARATASMVEALDAAGFDTVIVETVGAGQAEVDIARLAQSTVVVEAPSLGDDVQAIKAGILEVADVIVVNKADLAGADLTVRGLQAALDLGMPPRLEDRHQAGSGQSARPFPSSGWAPPILKTVATRGEGVKELADALASHRAMLGESGAGIARDRRRLAAEIEGLLSDRLLNRFWSGQPDGQFQEVLDRVLAHELSPRQATDMLLNGGV